MFPGKIPAQQYEINFQVFYDELSPYGEWVEDYNYGYIWIPTAGPEFIPYLSNGYWVFTNYGWMWTSGYDWGWAAFHYGRWDYNGSYGWFWVPDNDWGPSWVTWRRSEGYYGWAPMRPGVSISITFSSFNDLPSDRWIFVRDRDIERHDINRNYIDRRNNMTIINNSTVIDKIHYDSKRRSTYVAGPGRDDVQKVTGRTINPFTVSEKAKPGQSLTDNQVQIYRPRVEKNKNGFKPAPGELTKSRDVKRISERDSEKQPQINVQRNNGVENGVRQSPERPGNKINNRPVYRPRESAPMKKEINRNQPEQMRNANPPEESINNKSIPARRSDPPKKEITKVKPAQSQRVIMPKNSDNTNKSTKVEPVRKPKNKNNNEPPESRRKDERKEK